MLTIAAMSRSPIAARMRAISATGSAAPSDSSPLPQIALFEARARIVVKQKVETRAGKSRQSAMVAKGRADHEHGAATLAGRRTFLRAAPAPICLSNQDAN